MVIRFQDLQFLKSNPDESMKIRLILLLLILSGITSFPGFCQTAYNFFDAKAIKSEPRLSGELFSPASSPDIVTYFNKTWLSGDIWLNDGSIIRNKKIKYNGFLDELFWQEPESNQTIKLDKDNILQFHFHNFQGDTSVYFRKLKVKGNILTDSTNIFAQRMYRGDLSLFVLHTFHLDRTETIEMNKHYFLRDIYKENPVYYIKYLNNKVAEFKSFSRKSLYAFAPDKKDQIKKYFKENKSFVIKKNSELIRLMQFLSSVVEQ